MDTKFATFHGRYGGPVKGKVYSNKVCQFWLAGKCNRNPCRFLHRELTTSKRELPAASNVYRRTPKQSNHLLEERTRKTSSPKSSLAPRDAPKKRSRPNNMLATEMESLSSCTEVVSMKHPKNSGAISPPIEPFTKACQHWMSGNCVKGDGCQFLHSWSSGETFSMMTQLKGHTKALCGIALPSGSDKLCSASNDGMVNVWDCHTGQLTRTVNLGEKVGCLIGQGSWIFVGLQNSIKAWNFETEMEYTLGEQNEAFGLVYAMDTRDDDMLFTGAENGSILVWKKVSNDSVKPFKLAATLKGHTAAVTCLIVVGKRSYSGSTDGTMGVWDLDTLKCLQLVKEHTDVVRALICWGEFLISCSLDKKMKVWAGTKEGTIEVVYTHDVKHGAIGLWGIEDEEQNNPVLLCSCNDDCVRLYDLPSFQERGRIYSEDEIRRMQTGPGGLLFTGDALGTVSVWKRAELSSQQQATGRRDPK